MTAIRSLVTVALLVVLGGLMPARCLAQVGVRRPAAVPPIQAPARQPVTVPPNVPINLNPYVNPYQTLGQYSYNTAVLGRALQNVPPWAVGYPYYPPFVPGPGFAGAAPAESESPSYGSLMGGSGGYGDGSPSGSYGGYLSGAAAITTANAQYQLTIQQAKLVRQEAVRSAMDTRRRIIEQAEYERNHLPDPEKIRVWELARELDRARTDPPWTEVSSGKALNVLLRHLVKEQGRGEMGPYVSLSEETLKGVNLTGGCSGANAGLLRDHGNLKWPLPLQDDCFKRARENLGRNLRQAVHAVKADRGAASGTLRDLDADLKELNDTLRANIGSLSPSQSIEAQRYLDLVGGAIQALKDPNVSNHVNQSWTARGRNVAELVKFMGEQGLQFAPANPGDEPAYRALYHAMAAFDHNMTRTARR